MISQKKKKQSNKCKKKSVILLSIGIIVIKSKEIRVITYTCRYSSGHLIPGTLVSLLFITMIPIESKITNFFLELYKFIWLSEHRFKVI